MFPGLLPWEQSRPWRVSPSGFRRPGKPIDQPNPKASVLDCLFRKSSSEEQNSTKLMIIDLSEAMRPRGITEEIEHVADHDVKLGVLSDMGPGGARQAPRSRIVVVDIVILGTPIWLGDPSSIAQRVMERLNALLFEVDDRNRMPAIGKVHGIAVVRNEAGAHATHAACFRALNGVESTIRVKSGIYWVGEAIHATSYVDLKQTPDALVSSLKVAASNAARLLEADRFPGAK